MKFVNIPNTSRNDLTTGPLYQIKSTLLLLTLKMSSYMQRPGVGQTFNKAEDELILK